MTEKLWSIQCRALNCAVRRLGMLAMSPAELDELRKWRAAMIADARHHVRKPR